MNDGHKLKMSSDRRKSSIAIFRMRDVKTKRNQTLNDALPNGDWIGANTFRMNLKSEFLLLTVQRIETVKFR